MDTELVRPLTSNVIHIRSKDATELSDGYNSHFRVDLTNPILIEKGYEGHIVVSSAEIPYSFYLVSADIKNNTIIYNDGTEKTYTIPSKNYDIDELISTLTDDANFPFTATFDRYTMKITLANSSGGSITINWSNALSNAEKLLGFSRTDDVVANGASTTSDYVVNLCSVHSIFIKSNIATGNVQSTRAGNSSTLQKVSVDVNGFNMIYLNQDDFRTTTITQTPVIDFIEFRITDQNDNLIQFNNVNFELSFIINTYKIFVDKKENENYIGNRRGDRQQLRNANENIPLRTPNQTIKTPADRLPNGDRFTKINPEPMSPLQTDINSTHSVENKSEIEAKAEYTILDNLLENMK